MNEQTRSTTSSGAAAKKDTLPLTLPLTELRRGDIAIAGGKGANLGELVRGGFPVPGGFVVTTAAYDHFVALNGLGAIIARELRDPRGDGAAIREAFENAPIPREVERSVLSAYGPLGKGPVAVRSSATAEDLPEAAFAGQQDTYLNILGAAELLSAVRRCWASLFTDRAIAYRARQGLDQQTVKLAVVVQRMAAAEVAGVMFTANPITGARDEIVIDASPGLGEAIVSGLVTPDHYVLRKGRLGLRVVERRVGLREVVVQARAEGGIEHVSPSPSATPRPALQDKALVEIARLGSAVERHFGAPQDIEWAWVRGEPRLLQARPITALRAPPPSRSMVVERSSHFAEMLAVRPYPLDITVWGPGLFSAISPVIDLVGLHVPVFEDLFEEEDGVAVKFKTERLLRPTLRVLLAPARVLLLSAQHDPMKWRASPLMTEALKRARAMEARNLSALSWEDLLAHMREAAALPSLLAGDTRRRYFPRAGLAALRLRGMLELLRRGDLYRPLLSGVETKTIEANRALEDLAAQIRADPALAGIFARHEPGNLAGALAAQPAGRAFLEQLRAFLDSYGHREAAIFVALEPTWKDAPEVVLGILKGLASTEPHRRPERAAWEAARDTVLEHPLLRPAPLRSAFLKALAEARCFYQIREDTHFYATKALPILRRTALELGRRLVNAGALDTPADVAHLKMGDLERACGAWSPPPDLTRELRALVARRRERRAALEGTPLIDPRLFRRTEAGGDALVSGIPGGSGVAEGTVRVIRDSSEFSKLRAGDVLVAPFTNPAWTPLFQRAAAVVVDTGGAGSHAAIVAREYGVPAVMGTVDATRKLTDGERVRVDGERGLVLAAPPAPAP